MSFRGVETKGDEAIAQVESERDGQDLDQAYLFLTSVNDSVSEVGAINQGRLLAKIDWRIVPIMFLCYTVSFIDKVSLNVCVLACSFAGLADDVL